MMSNSNETIRTRLVNIAKLMNDPGATPGERENARLMLKRLQAKHNITDEDIEHIEDKDLCQFSYKKLWERSLLSQIVAYVTQEHRIISYAYFDGKGHKRQIIGFRLSKIDAIETKRLYDIYRKVFVEELDQLVKAFIHKHELYPPPSDNISPTCVNLRDLHKIIALSEQLQDVSTFPQLEDKHYE